MLAVPREHLRKLSVEHVQSGDSLWLWLSTDPALKMKMNESPITIGGLTCFFQNYRIVNLQDVWRWPQL